MYKNPLFLYTVFHKPPYCPYFHRSGRFPWRWLYNNRQFPEAEVRAGWGTGEGNERKGCFGKWRIAYSSVRYIVVFSGDGSGGGAGPGRGAVSRGHFSLRLPLPGARPATFHQKTAPRFPESVIPASDLHYDTSTASGKGHI
jgi:hypothetical protein